MLASVLIFNACLLRHLTASLPLHRSVTAVGKHESRVRFHCSLASVVLCNMTMKCIGFCARLLHLFRTGHNADCLCASPCDVCAIHTGLCYNPWCWSVLYAAVCTAWHCIVLHVQYCMSCGFGRCYYWANTWHCMVLLCLSCIITVICLVLHNTSWYAKCCLACWLQPMDGDHAGASALLVLI
jgi:hypothetical protein